MSTFGFAASGCWACSAADSDMPHLLVHRAPAGGARETSANVPQLAGRWRAGRPTRRHHVWLPGNRPQVLQGRRARHPPEFVLGLRLLAPASDVLPDLLALGEVTETSLNGPLLFHDQRITSTWMPNWVSSWRVAQIRSAVRAGRPSCS